jgi:uncharacterized damage-inducible protein DinB
MAYSQLIDQYAAGVAMVRRAVAGMGREQMRMRPVAGKWSTLECICHLADFEPVYADRIKRVIAEDQPQLASANEKCFAERLAYHDRDLEEELAIIEHTRRQLCRILKTLSPEDFKRFGIYKDENREETRTLERLLTIITNHIPHHVKFIEEKRKALGLAN